MPNQPDEPQYIPAHKIPAFIVSELCKDDQPTIEVKKHQQLSLVDVEINSAMRVRIGGCDDEGNELGEIGIQRDAEIINILHAPQVVTAQAISEQIDLFRKKLADVSGDYLRLELDFMELGGHMPSEVLPALFSEIVRGTNEKTYSLITEYVDGETRVPFAYHFGFSEMPYNDSRFPSLAVSSMPVTNQEYAKNNYRDIWTPWRVGVLRELTSEVCEKFATLDIDVPDYLVGKKGTRRGLNSAFKPVYGQTAKELQKKWITYNTATLHPPGDVAISIPNKALRESNKGLFLPMGQRQHVDEIRDAMGRLIANAGWESFGNTPESLLQASQEEISVLRGKGGIEIQTLLRVGHILADVIRRRQKLVT